MDCPNVPFKDTGFLIEKSPNQKTASSESVYRASWICPVDQPPIENGIVATSNGKITFVGRVSDYQGPTSKITDLGNGAVLPGLVNAHTHLEFSDLANPLGRKGIGFTDWVRLIVSTRIKSNADLSEKKTAAIRSGIEQSVASGVAAIGEIATAPFASSDYLTDCETIEIQLFLEQLGSDESKLAEQAKELEAFFEQPPMQSQRLVQSFGASPHAPYSCHPKLIEQICEQAKNKNRIVAMHLAETLAERELLEESRGEFVDLLKDFGVWKPELFKKTRSILSTLQALSSVRSQVVHGNYLTDDELDFISENRTRMSIAFCPRTHTFFDHAKYPLEKMLERKITVAIGTDSRASNPDLDLFAELKHVSNSFLNVAPSQILEMGTINGAKALGFEETLGTISLGKSATISFSKTPSGESDKPPKDWMFSESSTCRRIN